MEILESSYEAQHERWATVRDHLTSNGYTFYHYLENPKECIELGCTRYSVFKKGPVKISLSTRLISTHRGTAFIFDSPLPEGEITLELLLVEQGHRKQGLATEAIALVHEVADAHGFSIRVEPVAPRGLTDKKGGMTTTKLKKWYERMGYEGETLSNVVMIRKPQ